MDSGDNFGLIGAASDDFWVTSFGKLLMDGAVGSLTEDLDFVNDSKLLFEKISFEDNLFSDLAHGGLMDDGSGLDIFLGGNSMGFVLVGCEGNGLTKGWTSFLFFCADSILSSLIL